MATPAPTPARLARERSIPTKLDFARLSLWAGVAGFGGGLSVLAMLRAKAADEKRWVTRREFDNAATVAQMLPGGAAANLLALLGLRFFGTEGAVGAYATFIFPGFAAILALAGFYSRLAAIPHVNGLFGGLNAAVVGIVAAITLQMIRTSIGRPWQMVVAGVSLAMSVAGGSSPGEVALLGVGAGLVLDMATKRARLARSRRFSRRIAPQVALPDEGEPLRKSGRSDVQSHPFVPIAFGLVAIAGSGGLLELTLLFLRTGLGAYGGGFAIVPHLQSTLVATGNLTPQQFSNAVAIGKMTPGPVLLLATFIGYLKAGFPGAIVSTAAIFAGPLLLAVALGRWLARYRSRRAVRAGLRGLTPAVVGTMGAAAITLAGGLRGTTEVAIAAGVAMTMARFPVSPVLMLLAGGGIGLIASFFGG